MNMVLRPIVLLALTTVNVFRFLGELTYLIGDALAGIPRSLFDKQGRRLGWTNLWAQMVRVGVRSIPIVSLVLFCIGAILSLQMVPILRDYGASDKVADIIAVSVGRELGPLVSAIVLTGFAGASIAAELGTMVVSEEIEALEAQAINPIRFLVVPRILATSIMMVCISVVGDFAGGIGGLCTADMFIGISPTMYIHHTFDALAAKDFITGLVKAGVFGVLISALA